VTDRIYLDYNASAPIAASVVEAMSAFLTTHYGNPSSEHWAGAPARAAVTKAREQIAALIGASADEIVFTSGGSESNNYAIKGAFHRARLAQPECVPHFVSTVVEHPSVLAPLRFIESLGARVTFVPVDATGRIDADTVIDAVDDTTVLVSVMHAQNEVGTLQPIEQIGEALRARDVLFHCDAAQSVGKVATRVDDMGVDLLSIAGHKLYAPKGIGALYLRRGVEIEPLVHGAGHECGRRAGTENVLFDVALGAACELVTSDPIEARLRELSNHFLSELHRVFGARVVLNGHPTERLANTVNVGFVGQSGVDVLNALDGVAASTGAACDSGVRELSGVLGAMGVSPEVGLGAIRFSMGRSTTREQLDRIVAMLRDVVPSA